MKTDNSNRDFKEDYCKSNSYNYIKNKDYDKSC